MKNNIVNNSIKETIKKKWINVLLLIIAISLGILMQLVPPQILKKIIDNNILKGEYLGIWKLSIFYMLSIVVSGGADFLREFMIAILGQDVLAKIRFNMAKKLSFLPIRYFSENSVGLTMSYFTSDVDAIGTLFSAGIVGMIGDVLKALGIIISIYLISPYLSIYVLILIPIIYFNSKYFKKATLQAQMETRKAVGNINGFIQEIFNGIRTIKIFGMENHFLDEFQKPLHENLKAVHKTSIYDSIFPCLMQILRAIFITITVIIASSKIGAISLSIGSIAAVIDLISRLLAPVEALAMEFQTMQEAISGLKRVNSFSDEEEEIRYIQGEGENIPKGKLDIKLENVSFNYSKEKNILNHISLNIMPGTKVSIVGKTGAGKSTMLNLVAGLYKADSGSITIGGMNPFSMKPSLRRHIMGIVPQSFPIYEGTVMEAIGLNDKEISKEEVIRVAKLVGIHDDIIKLEKGYETLIGEGEASLSYGQYQLISLCSALLYNPPILLLDEMTSGLDSITEGKIFKAIKESSKDRTVITISHRISGIIDSDKVIVIDMGRIIEEGTPRELTSKGGWYAKYNMIEELGWKM